MPGLPLNMQLPTHSPKRFLISMPQNLLSGGSLLTPETDTHIYQTPASLARKEAWEHSERPDCEHPALGHRECCPALTGQPLTAKCLPAKGFVSFCTGSGAPVAASVRLQENSWVAGSGEFQPREGRPAASRFRWKTQKLH